MVPLRRRRWEVIGWVGAMLAATLAGPAWADPAPTPAIVGSASPEGGPPAEGRGGPVASAAPSASARRRPRRTWDGGPPAFPGSTRPLRDDLCDDEVHAWAARAQAQSGLAITPLSCVAGALRLAVSPAGCDFEISRDQGFERTADGAFGVSPIVDLEWSSAPAPMRAAQQALLAALAKDPSLRIRAGSPLRHAASGGWGRSAVVVGLSIVVTAAMVVVVLRRRRMARAESPT